MSDILTQTTEPAGACQHRWIIEPPAGPTSNGRCARCRTTRDFFNDPDLARRDRAAVVDEP